MGKGKGHGGNAHQRAVEKAKEEKLKKEITESVVQQLTATNTASPLPDSSKQIPSAVPTSMWMNFGEKIIIGLSGVVMSIVVSVVLTMFGVDDPVIGHLSLAALSLWLFLLCVY